MKHQYRGLDRAVERDEKMFPPGRNGFVSSSLPNGEQLMGEEEESWHGWFDNHGFIAGFVTPNDEVTKRFAQGTAGGPAP